ncbi:hypothetical protein FACS189451_07640 [Bacteroidia bacterium]|nr:hypothetical protein FACS189451_07640 [Bacteroidia bacterium]
MRIINALILLLALIASSNAWSQSPSPYLVIEQIQSGTNQTVVPATSTGPVGSQNAPTRLQFDSAFTVSVFVPTPDPYTGKTLFLYMQDNLNGSGAVNNWWLQGTPVNVDSMRFPAPVLENDYYKYTLTINTGQYPRLMNAVNYWSTLADGSIIRPSFYVGYTASPTTYADWGAAVINFIDIWGYKNIPVPFSISLAQSDIILEIDQYTPIEKNLEDSLLAAGTLSPGAYSWYMDDQYGVSPYTYTVNNKNAWMNNIYQDKYKPWINSSHIDWTNPDFLSTNSQSDSCYVLRYYVIPSSTATVNGTFVDGNTFNSQVRRVIVKIKPADAPPSMVNPITIAHQDYGSAMAGTQWDSVPLPSNETTYTYAGNNLPGDGQYSLAQDIVGTIGGGSRPIDWYVPAGGAWAPAKKYDHTSQDGTGFMYIVNADNGNGVFHKDTFNVCPQVNLQFSMWLANICDGTRANNSWNSKYRIKPNVHVQIWPDSLSALPTSGTPLLDYYTGEIPMTGEWEQYRTPVFQVPNGINKITVFYLSVNNGGDGNDFMMDDIQIQRSNGTFGFHLTEGCPCQDPTAPYQIHADWNSEVMQEIFSGKTSFQYKWSVYKGTDIRSIQGAGSNIQLLDGSPSATGVATYNSPTVSNSDIYIKIPGTEDGIYKLAIAAADGTGNIDDQCAIYSYYVFSPNHPPKIVASASVTDICPGSEIEFSVNIDTTMAFDAKNLLWFTIDDTTQIEQKNESNLIPLLGADGNQISGDKWPVVTVRPFKTTYYVLQFGACRDTIKCTVTEPTGTRIGFGTDKRTSGYVYRVCYSATNVQIPVTITESIAEYNVYLDGSCSEPPSASESLNVGETTISVDLTKIKPSPDNFRKGSHTITCAIVYGDCGNFQKFDIRFISENSVWVPGLNTTSPTDYNNWNNDANWYITDSLNNRYGEGGIPMACTNVVIPCDAMNYPILQSSYAGVAGLPTDDGFDPVPKCNTITFKFGGEVAQLQYLQYLKAYVEMNLGTYRSDSSFINTANLINTDGKYNYYPNFIPRDRYYSMSAPLKDMYSGDFAFGGKPNVYMKYADTILVETVRNDKYAELINKWTYSINSYNIPFRAGFGFGYEVYSGDLKETWPYARNQKNLNSALGVVRWPYFMNKAYLDSINPLHTFSGDVNTGAGTSEFTYFPVGMPNNPTDTTNKITRSSVSIDNIVSRTLYNGGPVDVPLANRFIVEGEDNTIPTTDFIIPFDSNQKNKDSEILVGNPFMSHLSFKPFYVANNTTIGQYYRIWQGKSAQYYSIQVDGSGNFVVSTDPAAGNDTLIAPMQSFFVPILSATAGNSITFNIVNMSKVMPNKLVALRSFNSNEVSSREILKIIAANSRYSASAVIIHKPGEKEPGEGVPKLFSPSGNIPEIYLIQDYKKEIIEINETPQAIPLEIKTMVGGTLKLTFSGLENFSSKVVLKDTKTGEMKALTPWDNVYSFMNNEGDQKNRFFLLFNDYTGIEKPAPDLISVFAANNRIRMKASSLDPMQSVKIYNAVGQLIESAEPLLATSYESRYISEKGVYIVNIKTKTNMRVARKVIVF